MEKINTLKNLPELLQDITEFVELCKTYDVEFELIESETEKLTNNFFFDTLDEQGCRRWEDMLNICSICRKKEIAGSLKMLLYMGWLRSKIMLW